MGMNIKDERVHAMAKELAGRRGTSVTDAVRQALKAEMERNGEPGPARNVATRLEALRRICDDVQALPIKEPRGWEAICADLYDEHGLPW